MLPFQLLSRQYGHHSVVCIKKIFHLHKKLAKTDATIWFLLKCKKLNITPNHLNFSCKNFSNLVIKHGAKCNKTNRIIDDFKYKILNLEIQGSFSHKVHLANMIKTSLVNLKTLVSIQIYNSVLEKIEELYAIYYHNALRVKRKKLLVVPEKSPVLSNMPENWCINLESRHSKRHYQYC